MIAATSVLLAALAVSLTYVCVTVAYRNTIHPLARYPGPWLARCTALPMQISALRLQKHYWVHDLHEQYGDVVRIAPDYLSFRDAAAVQDIYMDRAANVVKTGWAETSRRVHGVENTLSISDRQLHKERRRILSQALSDKRLKSLEHYMLSNIRGFTQTLPGNDSEWGEAKDMSHWFSLLCVDVLGDLAFGSSFGAVEAGHSETAKTLHISVSLLHVLSFIPLRVILLPIFCFLWKHMDTLLFPSAVAFRTKMRNIVTERMKLEEVEEKKPLDQRQLDFFYYLVIAEDPDTGAKFSFRTLVGEAAILLGAGADTLSCALATCLNYLTEPTEHLAILQREVRQAFSDVEEIRAGSKLNSLPYLRACIDETLRLSPPIPGSLDRVVLAGGASIDGKYVPAGVVVSVSAYALHRDARYFPDPDAFKPERWLKGDSDAEAEVDDAARQSYIPFGTGVRGCIGKSMAYMEMLTFIARLVLLFDMQRAEDDRDRKWTTGDAYIAVNNGPRIQFRRRHGVT